MQRGITPLFHGFRKYLGQREIRRRLAIIQLSGRAEDYLVKEFVYYSAQETDGSRFCEVNSGQSKQQKIDIVLLRMHPDGSEVTEAFVEAKFIRNRHRRGNKAMSALDELSITLNDLRRQLHFNPQRTHGKRCVHRRSKATNVYGLVFASYARRSDEQDVSRKYFKKIIDAAASRGIKYHDLPRPYLRTAFSEEPVKVMGRRWYVTLRMGLWRT